MDLQLFPQFFLPGLTAGCIYALVAMFGTPRQQELYARRNHYERPIETALAVVDAMRASSLELLMRLTDAEWERAGSHSESGRYSVDDWLRTYAAHPHDHAQQIRRALGR